MQTNQIRQMSLPIFKLLDPQKFNQYDQLPKTTEKEVIEADKYLKECLISIQEKILENLRVSDRGINQQEFNQFLESLSHLQGESKIDEKDKDLIKKLIYQMCSQGNFNKGILKQIALEGRVTMKLITLQVHISRFIHRNQNELIQMIPPDKKEIGKQFLSKTRISQKQRNLMEKQENFIQNSNQNQISQRIQKLNQIVCEIIKEIEFQKNKNQQEKSAQFSDSEIQNLISLSQQTNSSQFDPKILQQTQNYADLFNFIKQA